MRASGKAILFWLAYLAILFGAGMLKTLAPAPVRELAWAATSSAAVLALTLILGRNLVRIDRGTVPRFVAGLTLGLAMFAVHALVLVTIGGVRFTPGSVDAGTIALQLCTFLALSCMEELGYRGYLLRTLQTRFGAVAALLITALLFAVNHALFGWPWLKIVAGVIPGALLFGVAALASRGLAMPIGLHGAWNVATWAAGGTPAGSGIVVTVSFVAIFLAATAALGSYAARQPR